MEKMSRLQAVGKIGLRFDQNPAVRAHRQGQTERRGGGLLADRDCDHLGSALLLADLEGLFSCVLS